MSAEANTDGQSVHKVIYAYAFCCCSAWTSQNLIKSTILEIYHDELIFLYSWPFFPQFSWFNFGFLSLEEMSPYYITICDFHIRMVILSSRSFVTRMQKMCLFTVSHKTCLTRILWEKSVCNTYEINCKNSAWFIYPLMLNNSLWRSFFYRLL